MIVGLCVCKICRKKFTGPTGLIITPNTDRNAATRIQQFLKLLVDHIEQEHKKEAQLTEIQTHQFFGLSRMSYYLISDPDLSREQDMLRWSIHQSTLEGGFTDEGLKESATNVADRVLRNCPFIKTEEEKRWTKAAIEVAALEGFTEMRTRLQEPGKYETEAKNGKLSVPNAN